jgi:hypothetical protein
MKAPYDSGIDHGLEGRRRVGLKRQRIEMVLCRSRRHERAGGECHGQGAASDR